MSDNSNQKQPEKHSIEITRINALDELQSAKILFQEGLLEESKKKLYQILIGMPAYQSAQDLLKQIQSQELKGLLSQSLSLSRPKKIPTEDASRIIQKLNEDLGLNLDIKAFDADRENWIHPINLNAKEHYDVGVAFFEMGCYRDAARELRAAEKKIRMEQTFLGELGVSVAALYSETLVLLGSPYDAKVFLEPILAEPDLKLEEKNVLFYVMGLALESLGQLKQSKSWYQKVYAIDPGFRDTEFKLKQLS